MKRLVFSFFSGLLISTAAFYLSFRNIPVSQVIHYFNSVNYVWVFPSAAIILMSFGLRAIRWQLILSSTHTIGFWKAFHPLMTGFMLNCILPGRMGELARPAILKKKEDVPFSTGLATVAAERIFDVILLIILCVIVLLTVQIDPYLNIPFGGYTLNRATLITLGSGMIKLVLLLLGAIVLISFKAARDLIQTAVIGIPHLFFFTSVSFREKINNRLCSPLIHCMNNVTSVFSLLKDVKKTLICSTLSIGIWGLAALSYYAMAFGCPGIELSFLELSAVMIIICVFIALPSVPGYWGIWEAGGIFAMALFGVTAETAAGYTLVNHVVQMIPVIIVGLISTFVSSIKGRNQMTVGR